MVNYTQHKVIHVKSTKSVKNNLNNNKGSEFFVVEITVLLNM